MEYMMRKTIIFWGIVCSWLLSGCYEDKGNYDYIEVNEVTVTVKPANTYTIYGYLGEELTVVPELTFQNPSDTLEFDYAWKLDTTVISRERVLKYTHEGKCAIYSLNLFVTDRKSGQVYYDRNGVALQIDSPYKYGFVLLAEKSDGTTELHFLRLEKPTDKPFYYTPFCVCYMLFQTAFRVVYLSLFHYKCAVQQCSRVVHEIPFPCRNIGIFSRLYGSDFIG